jgi:ribonuclease J
LEETDFIDILNEVSTTPKKHHYNKKSYNRDDREDSENSSQIGEKRERRGGYKNNRYKNKNRGREKPSEDLNIDEVEIDNFPKKDFLEQENRYEQPERAERRGGYQNRTYSLPGTDFIDILNVVSEDYKVPYNLMETFLKPFVEKNQKMHHRRLNSFHRLDFTTNSKIRVTPLGGLGEIGGNITVFETENEAIVVDVGLSFPNEDMHGVDILIPDFTYLRQIQDKIVGIIITHGHEDHIGAVPYLFKEFQAPLYGTPLPLAMILNKFQEHKLTHYKSFFRPVEKRQVIEIGNDFRVEWIHMTHSIIDSSTLAITTEAGTLIHTGDFKFDFTPIDGYPPDLHRLAYYGEKGVLALLSDSTNSHNSGMTKSESVVYPTFDRIFSQTKGRIIMSTFSSNIHRVYQAIAAGIKYGRKVCVIGRSMERNIETAINYDYIRLNKDLFIEPHQLNRYRDNEVLVVTTGSQGETNSALYKIARNEHRIVKIKFTDVVIISARAIPGNEASISTIINYLEMLGAKVYNRLENIHVSGHASQEEQKLMLRLTKPKFFLPVHGEYNHVNEHRATGRSCGIPDKNMLIMRDGDQIELHPKYIKKVKHVKTGKTFIDNQNNIKIDTDIVIDRQKLATDGIVVVVAQVSKDDGALITKPMVTSFGLVSEKSEKFLAGELTDILDHFILSLKPHLLDNPRALEGDLKNVVRKHLYRKYKKYPLIVPSVFVM